MAVSSFIRFSFLQIKFLTTKPGAVLVQMGDPIGAAAAVQALSGLEVFENVINAAFVEANYSPFSTS